jgi:hypothetical protein
MGRRWFALAVVCIGLPWACAARGDAEVRLSEGTVVVFAGVDEARRVLTDRDDFVRRMSPFDRAVRLKTDRDVSEARYLEFVGSQVLAWDEAGRRKVASAVEGIRSRIEALALPLPFPQKVLVIKTTGKEEAGAAYTRGNAIVLPETHLDVPAAGLQRLICHELFHVLSRANPELRQRLYAAIGFVKCDEVEIPAALKARTITNPDAPKKDHCIRLRVAGSEVWAVPILFSTAEKYDVRQGGELFDYLVFAFLLVQRRGDSPSARPIVEGERPKLVGLREVSGLADQIGKNSDYVIDPEEILAENFAMLVLGRGQVPSPEILRQLERRLKEKRDARIGTTEPS